MKWLIVVLTLLLAGCSTKEDSWYAERWGGIVLQERDYSCGPASVLTVLKYHYNDPSHTEKELLRRFMAHTSKEDITVAIRDGLSLSQLGDTVEHFGYKTETRMMTLDELKEVVSFVPVIVYLEIGNKKHFAVVRGMNNTQVWLADPARGNVYHSVSQFLAEWKVPAEFRERWQTPGGLIIIHKGEVLNRSLLRLPRSMPVSTQSLLRSRVLKW